MFQNDFLHEYEHIKDIDYSEAEKNHEQIIYWFNRLNQCNTCEELEKAHEEYNFDIPISFSELLVNYMFTDINNPVRAKAAAGFISKHGGPYQQMMFAYDADLVLPFF